MWEDTLMIYHSDNGAPHTDFSSNGDLTGYKASLWEGGVRTVGFMFSENKEIQPIRGFTDCYVHVSDWYQTVITASGGWDAYTNATGLDMPGELDSVDQFSLLSDNSTCPRKQIMLHIDPVERVAGYLKGKFKLLIGNQDSKSKCVKALFYPLDIGSIDLDIIQLFDIYEDPYETTNIAEQNPGAVDELRSDVLEFLSHQNPLQCQLPTIADSNPCDAVPYYLPWDFSKNTLPNTAKIL